MQDLVIPGSVVVLITAAWIAFIPWLIYLTKGMQDNRRDIDINTANDKNVSGELERIYNSIDRLDKKLDSFLNQEMIFFKNHFNNKD